MRPPNLAIAAHATTNRPMPAIQAIPVISHSGAGSRGRRVGAGISRLAAGCGGLVGNTVFLSATAAPIYATLILKAPAYFFASLPSHTTPSISFAVRNESFGSGVLVSAAACL